MNRYFVIFIYISFLEFIMMPIGSTLGQSGMGDVFFNLFKIPFILALLLIFSFHLKFRIAITFLTAILLFFGCIALIYGAWSNGFTSVYISHIYSISISILGLSFGHYFYKYSDCEMVSKFNFMFYKSMFLLAFVTLLYFALFLVGRIHYFGMATKWPYLAAFLLANGEVRKFFGTSVFLLMAGKRSMLIQYVLFFVIYISQSSSFNVKRIRLSTKFALLFSAVLLFFVGIEFDVFYRFSPLLTMDLTDLDSLYIATSGRSAEILAAINHINSDSFNIFIGGGFGEFFSYIGGLGTSEYIQKTHYSHFSPLSYMLLYGVFFVILFYSYMVYILVRGFFMKKDVFYYIVIGGFISSFFSAILIVDLWFWFFLGGLIQSVNSGSAGKFNKSNSKKEDEYVL